MHAAAGDRGDVDHRALGALELLDQPARQHDGREEVDLEHVLPVLQRRLDGFQPRAALALGRDGGVADERVEPAVLGLEAFAHFADRAFGIGGIGEVDLDVILRPHLPGAVLREGVARAGDDAPARRGEALHRGVADAAAGAGEDQGFLFVLRRVGPQCGRATARRR